MITIFFDELSDTTLKGLSIVFVLIKLLDILASAVCCSRFYLPRFVSRLVSRRRRRDRKPRRDEEEKGEVNETIDGKEKM